jgi:tetratricopeptide (TPR) repeat protein
MRFRDVRRGLSTLALLLAACSSSEVNVKESELPAFDALWDFNDPAGTEAKFRELLARAKDSGNKGYLVELLTQIGRTEGLQQKYSAAYATLDQAGALVTPDMKAPRVRVLLERGRVTNSSGKPEASIPDFKEAAGLARAEGLEFYHVDAVHMLGIVTKGDESLRWNEEAIKLSEAATDPRARRWLGPLYNNTGWTYFDMRRYNDALRMFETDIEFRKARGEKLETGIARWSRAKVLRHLGRVDEALKIQMELLEVPELQGGANEGYTREEIGECLLSLGKPGDATPYFARAWELLREDPWLMQDEPKRLERLKELGKMVSRSL